MIIIHILKNINLKFVKFAKALYEKHIEVKPGKHETSIYICVFITSLDLFGPCADGDVECAIIKFNRNSFKRQIYKYKMKTESRLNSE